MSSHDMKDDSVHIHYVQGYPSLAAFIASDKDKSTAIFRRFDRLAARNLLHLQSQLAQLEAWQDRLDEEYSQGTTAEKAGARNWEILCENAESGGIVKDAERVKLANLITEKMKEYRESLILESTLLSLKPPASRTLEAFRNVFHNVGLNGASYPTLGGHSATAYDEPNDLVALKGPGDEDRLTQFLRNYLPILFIKQTTNLPLAYISERRLLILVGCINVSIAAGLLFGAIYHLYSINSDHVKLGLIAAYTIVFGCCVGLVTNARRSEVFAACAAYCAVLVVFISGNLSSSNATGDGTG